MTQPMLVCNDIIQMREYVKARQLLLDPNVDKKKLPQDGAFWWARHIQFRQRMGRWMWEESE